MLQLFKVFKGPIVNYVTREKRTDGGVNLRKVLGGRVALKATTKQRYAAKPITKRVRREGGEYFRKYRVARGIICERVKVHNIV